MLAHPWLRMAPHYDTKVSRRELREWKKVHGHTVSSSSSEERKKGDSKTLSNAGGSNEQDDGEQREAEENEEDEWESAEE